MIHAMTKHFAKWADKHKIPEDEIALALKEMQAFKEFAKILLGFSRKEIELAIKNGVLIEVTL
ncbi:hypothetical protein Dpo_1c09000 [Desulfotignum phosphitoxidans DSM 13687]|jgi:hypothetical protein|uniref:Uncharacterized protein n=2 Tax=Desulfotignum phosphitoxidans TaxID=190898 RepID=S0G327_9BACT|nr:hypothetical protein Dpo_1c09000 [Desulfotignum phosphitoxidans DSM 13687]